MGGVVFGGMAGGGIVPGGVTGDGVTGAAGLAGRGAMPGSSGAAALSPCSPPARVAGAPRLPHPASSAPAAAMDQERHADLAYDVEYMS